MHRLLITKCILYEWKINVFNKLGLVIDEIRMECTGSRIGKNRLEIRWLVVIYCKHYYGHKNQIRFLVFSTKFSFWICFFFQYYYGIYRNYTDLAVYKLTDIKLIINHLTGLIGEVTAGDMQIFPPLVSLLVTRVYVYGVVIASWTIVNIFENTSKSFVIIILLAA